jgi:hypothetical protein
VKVFYRYKRDQRELLDFSVLKSKEYIDKQKSDFMDLRVLLNVDVFGENSLSKEEYNIFNNLMGKEVIETLYNKNPVDDLILKF